MNAPVSLSDAAFRASHIGASEVAALFDASPYLTRFELFHRKLGTIDVPEFNATIDGTPENERIWWGVKLEAVIIEAACERWGYVPVETPARLDNGKGLGGHPDKVVMCPKRGRGILEVKTADWLVAKKWGAEPPVHYLLQAQSYAGLAGVNWADIVYLVGGNQLERHQEVFRPVVYADIETRVARFWKDLEAGNIPKPDYSRDGDTIRALYEDAGETLIDLRLDNRMPDLLTEYLDAKKDEKLATARVDAAQAEILENLGSNGAAMVEGFSCRVPTVAGKPDSIITADMVGQVIKGRKPHRRFYIKEKEA